MRLPKALAGLVCSLILGSCSAVKIVPERSEPEAMQLVATDLVNALVQVNSIPVGTTTLNLSQEFFDGSQFGEALRQRLEQAGYAIRTVGSNPADQLANFSVEHYNDEPDGEEVSIFTVTIGPVSVRRQYAQRDGDGIYPTAAMQLKGAVADSLIVSDELFKQRVSIQPSDELDGQAVQASSSDEPSGVDPSMIMADKVDAASGALAGDVMQPTNVQGVQAARLAELQQRPLQNFRELQQSNFSDMFQSLSIVRETVLPFGNDSTRVSAEARKHIARFVADFDVDQDVFSVIGCSNGATTDALGPEGLAMGRADGVTNELLRLGVPRQSILEEGCWSGEHFDEMMPRRGVVLSLQRYLAS